jgi:hypothetical protein
MYLKRSLPLFLLVLLALFSVPYFMATPSMQPGMTDQPSLPNLTILAVPAGQVLLFEARAKGVQIYPCDATTHRFGSPHPEAILVTHKGEIIHHTKGPTWTAADGSFVTGTKLQSAAVCCAIIPSSFEVCPIRETIDPLNLYI